MSRSDAQLKERLFAACRLANATPDLTVPLPPELQQSRELDLECRLKVIKTEETTRFLFRISYPFPRTLRISARGAFFHADAINLLLAHSKVFVARNLDGDRHYSLRMDAIHELPEHKEPCHRKELAACLERISQDVDTLLDYFADQQPDVYSKQLTPEKASYSSCESLLPKALQSHSDLHPNHLHPNRRYPA